MTKPITISFVSTEEQLAQVDELAAAEGRTRSSILRVLVDRGIEELLADERVSLTPMGEQLVHVDDVIRVLKENLGQKQYPALPECPADTDEEC